MNKSEENKILHDAIKVFGRSHQIDKVYEELFELGDAVAKAEAFPIATYKAHLITELVDVEIMLDQVRIMFGIEPSEEAAEREFKVKRLEARIDGMADGSKAIGEVSDYVKLSRFMRYLNSKGCFVTGGYSPEMIDKWMSEEGTT